MRCCRRVTGTSPLFSGIDTIKQAISGHGMCTGRAKCAASIASAACSARATSSSGWCSRACRRSRCMPPRRRFGAVGWMVASALRSGLVDPAGRRARVVDHLRAGAAVVGLARCSACKRLVGVFAFGAVTLVAAPATVPQVRERIVRTTDALTADAGRRRRRAVRPHPHLGRGRVHGARAPGQRRRRARLPRRVPGLRSGAGQVAAHGARARRCTRTRSCWRSSAKPARSACCCGSPASRWRGARGASRRPRRANSARPAMLALAATRVPVQHAPGVLFDVLGRADAAARRAVRRAPARGRDRRERCSRQRDGRGSPCGRRLKRRWIHRYCAGAARAIASIPAITRAVSAVASSDGNASSAGHEAQVVTAVVATRVLEQHHRRARHARELVGRGQAVRGLAEERARTRCRRGSGPGRARTTAGRRA